MKTKAKQVATKQIVKTDHRSRALVKPTVPAEIDITADAGAGMESMGREDFAIPRLTILQDLSPQVKKTESKFIKGAEAGHICDTLNGTVYEGESGILIVPVTYRRAHLEWKPNRGGFVQDHGSDGAILNSTKKGDKGENLLPNKNIITISAEYFVLLVNEDDGTATPYVLSMSGTQLKKSRRWNSMMNQLRVPSPDGKGTLTPAMFYKCYRLTTIPERNDQGSWFGWEIKPAEDTLELDNGTEVYTQARELRTSISEGRAKAQTPDESHGGSGVIDDSQAL